MNTFLRGNSRITSDCQFCSIFNTYSSLQVSGHNVLKSCETHITTKTTRRETCDRLAQLVEHRTVVRKVAGSYLGRTNWGERYLHCYMASSQRVGYGGYGALWSGLGAVFRVYKGLDWSVQKIATFNCYVLFNMVSIRCQDRQLWVRNKHYCIRCFILITLQWRYLFANIVFVV